MKFPTWFSITLAACLSSVALIAAEPSPKKTKLTAKEQWIVDQITNGDVADLETKFPDEKDRGLSAQFLEDLLTGALPNVKPHRNGVKITGATIHEPLNLLNAQIPSWVTLRHCQFIQEVNLGGANCLAGISFEESRFRANATFSPIKIGGSADFRKVIFDGKASFGGAEIAGQLLAQDSQFIDGKQAADFFAIKVEESVFFQNARFVGDANFYAMSTRHSASFQNAMFDGPANFGSISVGTDFSAAGAQFLEEGTGAYFNDAKIAGSASLQKAVFEGPVVFSRADIGNCLLVDDAQFCSAMQGAYFADLKVGGSASFEKAVFEGAVFFNRAAIKVQFVANEAQFNNKEKAAVFTNLKVDSGAFVRRAVFEGSVDLRFTEVAYFELDGTWFKNKAKAASFSGMKVEYTFSLQKATFEGPVEFIGATIKGQLNADDAHFNSEKEASFNAVKIGGTAFFRRAVFEGPATFCLAEVAQNFLADEARFKSVSGDVCLSMKCGGAGNFLSVIFAGKVSCVGANFGDLVINTLLDSPSVPELRLNGSVFQRSLVLRQIKIAELHADGITVNGPAVFKAVNVEHHAEIRYSHFYLLQVEECSWPKKGEGFFDMEATTYDSIKVISKDGGASRKNLLAFANQSLYAADLYTNLEQFQIRAGDRKAGDEIFIAGKRRERDEVLKGFFWIESFLLDGLVGYGRHPSNAGYICAFFVALGCFLFSKETMQLQVKHEKGDPPRVYNRFWYSLGLFLPFIDLNVDKLWKPKRSRTFLRHYVRVHILAGWVFVPIFLAALTGLIK